MIDLSSLTSDPIFDSNTVLKQSKSGYRFNADSLLLSWFIFKNSKNENPISSLEIGGGNGVVSIILKRRGFSSPIECIEIQDSLFKIMNMNVKDNNLSGEINCISGNFVSHNFNYESYDIIFSNPPYFGKNDGKVNPDSEKATARHELFGSLPDFFFKSYKLLKKKGSFFLVYPAKKLQYALSSSYNNNLYLKNIVFVKEFSTSTPSIFIAEFIKGLGENFLSNSEVIVMKNSDSSYTKIGNEVMYDIP